MSCGFCFHTATTSHVVPMEDAIRGITLLKAAGMRKINFAGGEPFLYPKFLGRLVGHCKEVGIESISIVSNGSKVTESFLQRYGRNIDILTISCDSFNEQTNYGRMPSELDEGHERPYLGTFAISVKCFQVLIVEGENDSAERLREAIKFTVTSDEFEHFVKMHESQESLVAGPNRLMAKSYLILDQYMRFLDRTGRQPSKSILDVEVKDALESVYWDMASFYERGGVYDWRAHPDPRSCADEHQWEHLQW